jgi:cytochrome c556
MEQAMEMRSVATRLARAAAGRDFEASRAGLVALTNACNRCHQTFRVGKHLEPFAE